MTLMLMVGVSATSAACSADCIPRITACKKQLYIMRFAFVFISSSHKPQLPGNTLFCLQPPCWACFASADGFACELAALIG